jgi:hypothetical protein
MTGTGRSIHVWDDLGALPMSVPRSGAAALLALLGAAALMVVARRLAGALANPLEPAVLFATGLLVASMAIAIRLGWLAPPTARPSLRLDRIVMVLTSVAVAALGVGLCVPDTSVVGMFLLGILLGTEESWAWAWHLRHSEGRAVEQAERSVRLDAAHAAPPRATRGSAAPHAAVTLDEELETLPDDVTQQFTRSQTADGTEAISGWLRLAFAAGQRTGSLHVAFCPPFAAMPELEVEQVDGPEARVRTAQLLPYGARLDLKLLAPADESTAVLLQFSAHTHLANRG